MLGKRDLVFLIFLVVLIIIPLYSILSVQTRVFQLLQNQIQKQTWTDEGNTSVRELRSALLEFACTHSLEDYSTVAKKLFDDWEASNGTRRWCALLLRRTLFFFFTSHHVLNPSWVRNVIKLSANVCELYVLIFSNKIFFKIVVKYR